MASESQSKDAQQMIKAEEKLIHDDPLHDVKEEILNEVDVAKSVDEEGGKKAPASKTAADEVVKSDVAPTFAEEYKKDHVDEPQPETKKEQ